MKKDQSLMVFPCDFPIKIIGNNTPTFAIEIINVVRKYFPDIDDTSIHNQLSQQGNYLAVSITLYVQDQQTLDLLYVELNKHPDIKMVL